VIAALDKSITKEHIPMLDPDEIETCVEEVEKSIKKFMNKQVKVNTASKGAFRKLCGSIGTVFKYIAPFFDVAVPGASVRSLFCSFLQ
jgi:hypothetical protein